jgi:TfoX/Sxy family transcriptional regulator of competence genes
MAYDELLAGRVRDAFVGREGVTERRMFGGVGFMLNGNMCVGVLQDELIVRLGPEQGDRALDEQHVRPFDLTGRAMTGWAVVAHDGIAGDEQLERWVDRAVGYVSALPAKT